MKVSGSYEIPAAREQVWTYLIEPDSLRRCIPGCKKLTQTRAQHYKAQLEVGIAGIKGSYKGEVQLLALQRPRQLKMVLQGEGKSGHLKGEGEIRLEEKGKATHIHYSGDLQIGGLIAAVGQRMLLVAARRITQEFFENLTQLTL